MTPWQRKACHATLEPHDEVWDYDGAEAAAYAAADFAALVLAEPEILQGVIFPEFVPACLDMADADGMLADFP